MNKIKQILKKQGFTLVELIIVIAIIAVLAVAAFMMLTKWLSKSRDSRRLSDLGTIERGLQVGYSDVDDGINMYPTVKNQTGAIGIMSGDEVVGYQGVVNIDVANAASMQKAPLDPSDNNEYTYLVSQNRQKFQLLAMLEDGTEVSIVNNVFALDYTNRFPTTKGFDLGIVLQESTNLPIQYASLGITGLDLTSTDQYVAVVKDDDIRSGTEAATAPIIKEETISIPEASEENGCKTQPNYSHASFTAGTPTVPNTDWQQDSSSNPCYYECLDGYSGIDCTTPPPGNDVLLIHSNTTNGNTNFTDSAGSKTISSYGDIKHTDFPVIKKGVVLEESGARLWGSNVIKDGNLYKIWYSNEGNYIGYATSTDGVSWTKQGIAISLGTTTTFDDKRVQFPFVLKESDNSYKMWYGGSTTSASGRITRTLYATSTDGVSWNKQGIAINIEEGNFDSQAAYMTSVIKESDNSYKMWYSGNNGVNFSVGYATSTDGINWNKYSNNPIIDITPQSFKSNNVYNGNVIKEQDGTYSMFYYGYDGNNNKIGYATSTDGINWNEKGPIIEPSLTFESAHSQQPTVIKEGDVYKIWYVGYDGSIHRIGYAESTDLKFGSSVISFDGNGDYLSIPDSEDFNFGGDDFTIDFWVNREFSNHDDRIIDQYNISNTDYNIATWISSSLDGSADKFCFLYSTNGSSWDNISDYIGTITIPKNTWTHIAIVRNNTTISTYVNGIFDKSWNIGSGVLNNSSASVRIGASHYNNGERQLKGYLDEIRIRKGGAVRTENFTPPTSPY